MLDDSSDSRLFFGTPLTVMVRTLLCLPAENWMQSSERTLIHMAGVWLGTIGSHFPTHRKTYNNKNNNKRRHIRLSSLKAGQCSQD